MSGHGSNNRTFEGFLRPDGRVGTRNNCLILCINGLAFQAARRAAAQVPTTIFIGHGYGRGQVGEDAALMDTLHFGLATHPNVGHAIIVGADNERIDVFIERLRSAGQSAEGVTLQDVKEDGRQLSERIVARAARAIRRLSEIRRQTMDASHLMLALQCGHSDFSSGLIANPVVGMTIDRMVDAEATVIFGETVEWLGGEHNLTRRAARPEIAEAIKSSLRQRIDYALERGEDVTRHNPLPQNIAGGLTTTEEKALGAIVKGGTTPILGVLNPAQRPGGPGLYLMDTPFFSPESITCLVAAGAQITVFTTGPGNSYCSAVAPTIKVSANVDTCQRIPEQIDFPLDGVALGQITKEDASAGLQRQLMAVASGTLTFGEILGEGNEVIGRSGASL